MKQVFTLTESPELELKNMLEEAGIRCPTCGTWARRVKQDGSLNPAHEGTV